MLKIGNQAISSLYIGNQEIFEAYLGNELVYSKAKPLTFEIGSTGVVSCPYTIEVKKNNNRWVQLDSNGINVVAGDVLKFRGNITHWDEMGFTSTATISKVKGNLYSVAFKNNYSKISTLPSGTNFMGIFSYMDTLLDASELLLPATTLSDNCYYEMFLGCSNLSSIPTLPATTLTPGCYFYMYGDCTSLTTIPSNYLPATTLAYECYHSMFGGCTSLTTIPSNLLLATTLANECYTAMFGGCTSLTTAPELPATTLANNCYYEMFYDCTSLTTAPELPATTLADRCYYGMFYNCTSLVQAPELPATTLANNCYYDMFAGCTSLTTAPTLPATTLANYCYYQMFYNCTSLNYIKCLATNKSASNCTTNWVQGVSSTGTFVKNAGAIFPRGINGIPTNWIAQNINYTDEPLTFEISSAGTVGCYQTLEVKKNNGNWVEIAEGTDIDVVAGDVLKFRGNITEWWENGFYATATINKVKGNLYSVAFKDTYVGMRTLPSNTNFMGIFSYMDTLVDASELELPATILSDDSCYTAMFYDCTSLTTAPELPATTLASHCYECMFYGCTSLTTAPSLPATTLANYCYQGMFRNCTSLNYILCLATDISASYCTTNWVQGVSSTGTFVKNANATRWTRGVNGIPTNWIEQGV